MLHHESPTNGHEPLIKQLDAKFGQGPGDFVAYLRKVSSDDLRGRFPTLGEIAPGMELWALFSANGQPILLSDARDRALAGAMENDLVTVAIH